MANSLTGPVWKVDTAATLKAVGNRVVLKGVQWIAVTASAADRATLTDGNDREVWSSVATGANYDVKDGPGTICNGLKCSVINSGYLLIELG